MRNIKLKPQLWRVFIIVTTALLAGGQLLWADAGVAPDVLRQLAFSERLRTSRIDENHKAEELWTSGETVIRADNGEEFVFRLSSRDPQKYGVEKDIMLNIYVKLSSSMKFIGYIHATLTDQLDWERLAVIRLALDSNQMVSDPPGIQDPGMRIDENYQGRQVGTAAMSLLWQVLQAEKAGRVIVEEVKKETAPFYTSLGCRRIGTAAMTDLSNNISLEFILDPSEGNVMFPGLRILAPRTGSQLRTAGLPQEKSARVSLISKWIRDTFKPENYGYYGLLKDQRSRIVVVEEDFYGKKRVRLNIAHEGRNKDGSGLYEGGFECLESAYLLNGWLRRLGLRSQIRLGKTPIWGAHFYVSVPEDRTNFSTIPGVAYVNGDITDIQPVLGRPAREEFEKHKTNVPIDAILPMGWREIDKDTGLLTSAGIIIGRIIDYGAPKEFNITFQHEVEFVRDEKSIGGIKITATIPKSGLLEVQRRLKNIRPEKLTEDMLRSIGMEVKVEPTGGRHSLIETEKNKTIDILYYLITKLDREIVDRFSEPAAEAAKPGSQIQELQERLSVQQSMNDILRGLSLAERAARLLGENHARLLFLEGFCLRPLAWRESGKSEAAQAVYREIFKRRYAGCKEIVKFIISVDPRQRGIAANCMVLLSADLSIRPCCINHEMANAITEVCAKQHDFFRLIAKSIIRILKNGDPDFSVLGSMREIVCNLLYLSDEEGIHPTFGQLLTEEINQGQLLGLLDLERFPLFLSGEYVTDLTDGVKLKELPGRQYYWLEAAAGESARLIGLIEISSPHDSSNPILYINIFDDRDTHQGIGLKVVHWAIGQFKGCRYVYLKNPAADREFGLLVKCEKTGVISGIEVQSAQGNKVCPTNDYNTLWHKVIGFAEIEAERTRSADGKLFARGRVNQLNVTPRAVVDLESQV